MNSEKFVWTPEYEDCYKIIKSIMNSETVLKPFDPGEATIMTADAAPGGIAANIYQVHKEGVWVAVDHARRDLSFSNAFVRCSSVIIFQNQVL